MGGGGIMRGDIDLMGGPNFDRLYHKLKVLLMLKGTSGRKKLRSVMAGCFYIFHALLSELNFFSTGGSL